MDVCQGNSKAVAAASISQRHRGWWKRRCSSKVDASHRLSAKKWIEHVDAQLRGSTAMVGPSCFKPDWESAQWSDSQWQRWPFLLCSQDCRTCSHSQV
mmetsp:Transcript_143783/g.460272  ORF Transcript_143783/g.460272 Transcript_143783/m.460272 type:complete len:98 (+) Transcript_143783:1472-1765(+)